MLDYCDISALLTSNTDVGRCAACEPRLMISIAHQFSRPTTSYEKSIILQLCRHYSFIVELLLRQKTFI